MKTGFPCVNVLYAAALKGIESISHVKNERKSTFAGLIQSELRASFLKRDVVEVWFMLNYDLNTTVFCLEMYETHEHNRFQSGNEKLLSW